VKVKVRFPPLAYPPLCGGRRDFLFVANPPCRCSSTFDKIRKVLPLGGKIDSFLPPLVLCGDLRYSVLNVSIGTFFFLRFLKTPFFVDLWQDTPPFLRRVPPSMDSFILTDGLFFLGMSHLIPARKFFFSSLLHLT